MKLFGFFDRRVRGFRVVEVGALSVLLVLILAVYLAKTGAGGKRADIDRIQQQIFDEQSQIRMLRAEVATLEQPERLETLATHYLGLQPISARREVTPEGLQDVAQVSTVNSKVTLVTNDPLTQKGSPDLPAGAAPPAAVPVAAALAPAAVTPPAQPVALNHAQAAAKPAPIRLAQAEPAPRHAVSHAKASGASAPGAVAAPDAIVEDH